MCGIAGYQGRFADALLPRMVAAVAHRGPDGDGMLRYPAADGQVTGLGHRRLSIIDVSDAGRQPMSRGDLTIIFNGEIYNYRELRAELAAAGYTFTSASDTEVLLYLYERHGLEMLSKLLGIFAFAIRDGRASGRPSGVACGALFLARDQIGVKPLYLATTPQGVLFASEIKALLCESSVSRELDPVAIHETLAFLWTPTPRTPLRAVRKVAPGTALVVDHGRVTREWRYYRLPYDGTRLTQSEDEVATAVAGAVETAVRRQMVSDVPVGAFLSGGLDSSAVVAMMRRAAPDHRVQCFSIGFGDRDEVEGNPSDLPYARTVAAHLGVDLEEIQIDASVADRLEGMVEVLDELHADPAPLNAWIIAERARAMGIPVLLSGAGGDDLFTGYRRHRALQMERWWDWLPAPLRRRVQAVAVDAATGRGGHRQSTTRRRLVKMWQHAGETPDRRLAGYFQWSPDALRRGLYTPAFAAAVAETDTSASLLASLGDIPDETDRLARLLFLETRHFLADHNLNYTDRAGMAAGVEVRVPLLDLDLVALAARIPSSMKQQGAVGKAIFKRAMEPYLPREVIYRPKTGFGAPLREWLRDPLRVLVDDTLSTQALTRRGVCDPAAVHRLIAMDREGRVDGGYTIYALMTFELWCRRFVDAHQP